MPAGDRVGVVAVVEVGARGQGPFHQVGVIDVIGGIEYSRKRCIYAGLWPATEVDMPPDYEVPCTERVSKKAEPCGGGGAVHGR